jgi:nitrous oxidase accessory protein
MALLLSLPPAVSGAWLHVADGDQIATALKEARPGDTIVVAGPGVFAERLVIDRSIRLHGTGSPVIDGGGAGSILTITAPRVEVTGVVLRNSGGNLQKLDAAVMITSPGVTVRNCRIENAGFGIYLRGSDECVLESNEMIGSLGVPSARRGNGIHLWKARRNRMVGNSIRGKRDGLYLSYADDNVIAGNRVSDTRFGIHYMYSHRNRLLTNSLVGNSVGATLMFSRDSVVEGNQVWTNRRHGMVLKQVEHSRVTRNVVAGQNRGLFVQQATGNRFEGNWVAGNDIGLYLSGASEQNTFVGNGFIRNTDHVWQPVSQIDQDKYFANVFFERGRGNYWSDYTGGDRDRDGVGDTPYHETDVFGYLVDRNPAARLFALSPALALLRKGEELLPVMDMGGVADLFPRMAMPPPPGWRAGWRPAGRDAKGVSDVPDPHHP